jgi:phosphopantothenoylcysteine decarboxylase / phosphopantothenate---cysteine ligase
MSTPSTIDHLLSTKKIVLGVTGSIAAYKAAELVRLLRKAGAEVQVLMTPDAARFIAPLTLGTLSGREVLIGLFPEGGDAGEGSWTRHVELGLWADLLVVAPATATTLARLAAGVCDSMLTATALSRRCPMLLCPAMDHDMWRHPATQRNIQTLRADGAEVMPPDSGELASGLIGEGRLPEPEAILARITAQLVATSPSGQPAGDGAGGGHQEQPLAGITVLVTAGPTREAIDPVRFLSNGATGTMGFALAEAAAARGARVTLVAGPTALPTPPGVDRVDVTSADEMYTAAMEHAGADLVIAAAAVADYAPAEPSDRKAKKGEGDLVLRLRRTPDILAAIGQQRRPGQTLVGFALETHDGEAHARDKLRRKRLDWVVLNYANEEGAGFGTGTNRVVLLGRDGSAQEVPQLPKRELAERLLDTVVATTGEPSPEVSGARRQLLT